MAKKKTTKKETVNKVSKDEIASGGSELFMTGKDIEQVQKDNVEHYSKPLAEEIKNKPLNESDVDNELKDALKTLGSIQSKYQQLGRTPKARKLRDVVRGLRTGYKEWK